MPQTALRPVNHHAVAAAPHTPLTTNAAKLDDAQLLDRFLPNAHHIFAIAGDLRTVLSLPYEDLAPHGVTPNDYIALHHAVELGRRFIECTVASGEFLTSPDVTRRALLARVRDLPHEVFGCIYLTSRQQIIDIEELFRGSVDQCHVYASEVVKQALRRNATALVVYHNHVSGDPEESLNDKALTKHLAQALSLVNIRLLDHFIIGAGKTLSFSERGWL